MGISWLNKMERTNIDTQLNAQTGVSKLNGIKKVINKNEKFESNINA